MPRSARSKIKKYSKAKNNNLNVNNHNNKINDNNSITPFEVQIQNDSNIDNNNIDNQTNVINDNNNQFEKKKPIIKPLNLSTLKVQHIIEKKNLKKQLEELNRKKLKLSKHVLLQKSQRREIAREMKKLKESLKNKQQEETTRLTARNK
eukprot:TRINITY_DN55_c1_g1_i1.p1 TRINITY_DN55_c1_g1~~TRINITY_DN55_c1_g1_i1.p1  ORF type:complete len:166 (+),score=61.12 TRINITY_DN55_c1_g1_i1:52-498(+)